MGGREVTMKVRAILALALASVACSSAKSGGTDTDAGSGSSSGGVVDGGGSGTIAGEAVDASFTHAAGSLWIGAPDDPMTTVVYIFSNPIKCSELAMPGWDQRITDRTQILEMKAFGTTPGMFTVVTTVTPAPGEAVVNYTLSSTAGTPAEQVGSGGTITIVAFSGHTDVTGNFNLQFGNGMLTGSFDAAYCPGGHEP
jgi:hypothetical protein